MTGLFRGAIVYTNVPEPVLREIEQALTGTPDGPPSVAELYRRFRLKQDYDVGVTSFRQYARRVLNLKRKESVGRIAAGLFPAEKAADANALQQRAHLLLVQHIVRGLEDSELPTSELCSLARAYTAQRKLTLDAQRSRQSPGEGQVGRSHGEAPAEITRLVCEIYGVGPPKTDAEQTQPS